MNKIKALLTGRAFWAALVGLVLICLAGMLPGMPETSTEITQAVIVLAAYITGTAIEGSGVSLPPEPLAERLKRLVASRKLWASLVGLAFICLKQYRPDFPLSEEQLYQIVTLLAAYILGVGISDRRLG
jgi:Na+(H+)/acetate symporter ActP